MLSPPFSEKIYFILLSTLHRIKLSMLNYVSRLNDKGEQMITRLNETHRKFPRTIEDAFGPYSRGPIIDPKDQKMPIQDKITVAVGSVVLIVCLVLVALGY